jgi:hypothetical protein
VIADHPLFIREEGVEIVEIEFLEGSAQLMGSVHGVFQPGVAVSWIIPGQPGEFQSARMIETGEGSV